MNYDTNAKKLKWISALRGLACIIVVFAHIVSTDDRYGNYANGCGKIGVWLFILLSGLLFARSAFFQSEQLSVSNILMYYEKKVLRIYPSLLISLGLYWVLFHSADEIKSLLLLKNAWGHYWYIPVILKFYFISPILVLIRQITDKYFNHGNECFCIVMLVVAIILSFVFPFTLYVENSTELRWYLPVFVLGIILSPLIDYQSEGNRWLDLLTISGILAIICFTPAGREIIWGYPPGSFLQNKYLLISICWILVLLGVFFGRSTKRILEKSILLPFLSEFSYEIYLFHFIVLVWIQNKYQMSTLLRGIITIVCSLVLAIIVSKTVKWIQRCLKPHIEIVVLFFAVIAFLIFM